MAGGTGYLANRDSLVKDFVATARKNMYWIYNPDNKSWYTPEEFLKRYNEGIVQLNEGWLEKYKIMNPQKGLAAAEILEQQLRDKRLAFQQRVIDYYQTK